MIEFWKYFIACVMWGIAGFIMGGKFSDDYKRGQIDALTGTIKYELVRHPDSTKTWEKIE